MSPRSPGEVVVGVERLLLVRLAVIAVVVVDNVGELVHAGALDCDQHKASAW